jgi:hypothetical protein
VPSSSVAAPDPSTAARAAATSSSSAAAGARAAAAGLAFVRWRARIASIRSRSRIASRICSRYAPEVYISVWLTGRYSIPSSASAATIGALKCSAQLACGLPAGAGTDVSGLPMCSAQDGSTPTGTFRNRS